MTPKNAYPKDVEEAISDVGSLTGSLLRITGNGFGRYNENGELTDLLVDCAGSVLAAYEFVRGKVAAQNDKRALKQYEVALKSDIRRVAALIPKTSIM